MPKNLLFFLGSISKSMLKGSVPSLDFFISTSELTCSSPITLWFLKSLLEISREYWSGLKGCLLGGVGGTNFCYDFVSSSNLILIGSSLNCGPTGFKFILLLFVLFGLFPILDRFSTLFFHFYSACFRDTPSVNFLLAIIKEVKSFISNPFVYFVLATLFTIPVT